jgi:hypothetical protein
MTRLQIVIGIVLLVLVAAVVLAWHFVLQGAPHA